jgi:hypothetical protein
MTSQEHNALAALVSVARVYSDITASERGRKVLADAEAALRGVPLELACADCRRPVGRVLCRWCAKRDEPRW